MASLSKIAIVTGANQGLGFALAEGLAPQLALAPADIVYLTGRSRQRLPAAGARISFHAVRGSNAPSAKRVQHRKAPPPTQ